MIGGRVGGFLSKDGATNAAWGAAGMIGGIAAFRFGKRLKTTIFSNSDEIKNLTIENAMVGKGGNPTNSYTA